MEKIIKYTHNLDEYDPNKASMEAAFSLRIIHDNSQDSIEDKFKFDFLNSKNEKIDSWEINSWIIKSIYIQSYYSRAKVYLKLLDPKGIIVDFESGGYSLYNEEYNINRTREALLEIFYKVRKLTFFLNYKSMYDFYGYIKEKHPDEKIYFY